jgi:hypothetical protein
MSPVHLAGARDSSTHDLAITWHRRTRYDGEWEDLVDVPLGEKSEAYEIELRAGGDLLRTAAVSSETATYTLAEYNSDSGGSATEIPSLQVTVFQLGADIGRGYDRKETI